MTRAEIKAQAKASLRGNWGWGVLIVFVGGIMASLIGSITIGIVALMIDAGIAFSFLDLVDQRRPNGIINGMFSGFTSGNAMAVFLTTLLTQVFTFLWTLLFFVPGIIKGLSYSQANYILRDWIAAGRQIDATDAITASRELMVGHKMEYFVLQLSFIGWALLCIPTLGIGLFWLAPYIHTTNAVYYRNLVGAHFTEATDEPAY
ncbi:DUF975 family protein [Lacticaseibacillus mingshuiensis]|uniref:DUF975 family protein n=1 Tax=Lacticaseibacillus mingshuiensis TaxID=2799574 RepID=A0ABW4CGV3_9LACO|nr:DUF975 family protein [Lacticaseibacillus mingshuiensis]